MNKQNYKWVVYFIGITIITTIAVQVYWNYREYQLNKQHLIDKVQLSLDNSVETYFSNLTKSGIITYKSLDSTNSKEKTDTIVVKTNSRHTFRKKIDSTLQNLVIQDSSKPILIKSPRNNQYPFFTSDRHFPKNIDSLISKVFISISRDTLDLDKLNSHLTEEFKRNKIDVRYGLKYKYRHRFFRDNNDNADEKVINYGLDNFPEKYLKTTSHSTFLPHKSKLELFFTNETTTLFRNSFISIFLSLLLSISIIGSLIYLLKTIYKQKQLAEVKNDLISNITHEFKTPIATIATALEAMKSFNALDDKVKSEKYISIANSQVNRLHEMVEKILETATLNHEELVLNKQAINLVALLEHIIDKYKTIQPEKTFNFTRNIEQVNLSLDKFHFENAIGNLIDNAIKYGGNTISIELILENDKILILLKDSGNGIHKSQKEKVFDQFYRISTGNTHTIKGFGIGLFYTKKIIEKHGGTISIIYDKKNNTIFKIELLNE